MKLLQTLLFSQLVGIMLAQTASSHRGVALPNRPVAFVQSLYRQVVHRHPGGIPSGKDAEIFAPYMSAALLHKIDLFNACVADWDRQHNDPDLPVKSPFGIFESGIFSGGDERTAPQFFHPETVEASKDGSYRVTVKLTWKDNPPFHYRENWRVVVTLNPEGERLVVDDVMYIGDRKRGESDWRLSQSLSLGCDGGHWVGDAPHRPIKPLQERVIWVR